MTHALLCRRILSEDRTTAHERSSPIVSSHQQGSPTPDSGGPQSQITSPQRQACSLRAPPLAHSLPLYTLTTSSVYMGDCLIRRASSVRRLVCSPKPQHHSGRMQIGGDGAWTLSKHDVEAISIGCGILGTGGGGNPYINRLKVIRELDRYSTCSGTQSAPAVLLQHRNPLNAFHGAPVTHTTCDTDGAEAWADCTTRPSAQLPFSEGSADRPAHTCGP